MERGKAMKKFLAILVLFVLVLSLVACGGNAGNDSSAEAKPDYEDAVAFESALDAGEVLTGKTVAFTVNEFVLDSAFGYNMQAGENLNFCSPDNPGVKTGDSITVKVTEVASMLGSYIISYEMVK